MALYKVGLLYSSGDRMLEGKCLTCGSVVKRDLVNYRKRISTEVSQQSSRETHFLKLRFNRRPNRYFNLRKFSDRNGGFKIKLKSIKKSHPIGVAFCIVIS